MGFYCIPMPPIGFMLPIGGPIPIPPIGLFIPIGGKPYAPMFMLVIIPGAGMMAAGPPIGCGNIIS